MAIIGMGGTGGYILDFIARTHLEKIALYDADEIHLHTVFRIPGHIDRAIGRNKAEAFAEEYHKWHSGIEAYPYLVTNENISELQDFDFVFVSVDDGGSRRFITDWLSANGIPFIDCGMGINRSIGGLNAMVRITGVSREAYESNVDTPYLPTDDLADDEYKKQVQIAEFNALNAVFAVIRFKQHFGLYEMIESSAWHLFESATFDLDNEVPNL